MVKKSPEFYQEAYEKFRQIDTGQSAEQLAIKLGVDRTTIGAWRRGRVPDDKHGPISDEVLEQAKHMLEQGITYKDVSDFLSVGAHTLYKHFPNMGWKHGQIKRLDYDLEKYV